MSAEKFFRLSKGEPRGYYSIAMGLNENARDSGGGFTAGGSAYLYNRTGAATGRGEGADTVCLSGYRSPRGRQADGYRVKSASRLDGCNGGGARGNRNG